ncbi:Serine/threonine-protein phosphatase 2A regulatory subunit B'' subunit gamma [Hondaea fermentalgiana]|uniref:Serine/threonine-protein phosphatase 2A regulatory subunit B'' subunit gamma n=1 Tax=Hondaea fermentalgiana TaxID=2315210 RepID=A0A2R5GJ48_9STRA|nr:Serine/threonine-protein phosphatase 2A regulatory subunit B'' subunit gamma [Hondaea fermentalgiana]|eukprot:GBG30910.1 Serine/threonine-protein phosphatase 2A regulatory subunit B'' subunit gamma [Hondaea fermentalgiana]
MLVARILGKEGIEASVELVEAILAAKRHMTAREARDFPHKFSCVRVADLAHGNLQDEDLLEICCGVFPRLKILKLHGNRLRSLPNLYTLGSHLRMLDLSANGLERLPHNESVWAHFRCLGQQAAVAIQRVWMKRDVRAHRAASATVLASFFSSVQTYRRGATETLRRRGFSGQDVAFLACHRDIDPEAFEAVLKFSCAYALRVADANIDTGASDTTLAECFLGKSALEVQRGDLKESFSYLSGKRRLETSLQSMHARCASMQAMCARWGDAEAWNAKRNRFWRDIRRLEASMAVMQDRLTVLHSNPRSLAHTCWSRDARFAKVSRRVAGIRRPPRLDAMLASMQAQRHEDARADVVETQLSRSPLYVLYGPLAQPSVLAWAMHALRALLRREKVARRLKVINGPLLAAKKSRTQGALVEVYPGEKVLREAGVRLAQSVWRAYAARKAHNVQARALLQRGATCIQRAWRSAPFRARMAFVESLAQYLQRLDVMTYRKAYYLLPGDATNGSLDWAKNGADSDDADKEDADKDSSFRIGQAQEVPTEEANQSPCLFIEESVLRVIRRLKGRKLLRNPSTLMAAQESSLGSECTFSYANHLRLLSARSSPTTLGREVRDSAPEAIASSDGEAADFWIRPPPWHRAFLRHGAAHAREGFVEDTLLEQCEGNRPGLLRVGIPDWMHVSPGLLEATQRNAQTSNADLCRIITRGAILTSGELVVPRDGAAGTGKYFEKISMAQRLADSTSTEEPAPESVEDSQTLTSVVKTGIVLVRLKFQSHAEARARAAMCFARTWQARTRESLFVVAEHMLGDAYGKTRQNQTRVAWGGIPSTYTSIIKRVISQHDRIEENARRARAVQTSSEYAHRASTLQGRRKRRFGRQTGNDDGDEQEEDAVEAWKEEDDGNDDPVSNDEGEDEVAAQLAEQLAALDAFNSTFSIRKGSIRKPQSVLRARKRHPRRTKPAQLAEHGQFLASLDTLPLLAPTGERVGVVASAKGTGRAPIDDVGQDVDGLWPKSSPTSQSQSAEDHHHHHHLEDISRAAEMVRIEGLWLDSHLRAADEAKHKRLFFQADTFCKFRRDDWGRISTQLFFQYVCRHITLQQTRAHLALYDSHGDGCLREQDLENYIYELIPSLEALEDLQENFYPFYVFTAVRKFFFFLDPRKMGRIPLRELITSPILHELLHLQNAPNDEDIEFNWFSAHNTLRVYSQYLELDIDHNGMLSRAEIQGYGTGSLTSAFIGRVFEECLTYDGEIDYKTFLDFVLAMETKKSAQSLAYFFRLLDVRKQSYLDRFCIRYFFSEIVQKLRELDGGGADADVVRVDDVCDEIFDMCNPRDPCRITLADLVRSGIGDTIVTMLTDLSGFWAYDNREHLIAEEAREEAEQRALNNHHFQQEQDQS